MTQVTTSRLASTTSLARLAPRAGKLSGIDTITTMKPCSAMARAAGAYASGRTRAPGYKIKPAGGSRSTGVNVSHASVDTFTCSVEASAASAWGRTG